MLYIYCKKYIPQVKNTKFDLRFLHKANIIDATTDIRPGLFRLGLYTPSAYSNGYFWLASPDPSASYRVRYVNYNGDVNSIYNNYNGVRPVVSMSNVTIKREAGSHVWKIQ